MSWKGNHELEDTFYFLFTTRQFSTGAPFTLAGTPVISVYEENNATQITAGVSISADYDSVTGLNQVTIVATAANGYEAGKSYEAVITTGTVDSVSVVGEVVGRFGVDDLPVNVTQLGSDAQSATDLKDFADVGYDPATNKVQGVVLVDTTTTNTDMVGTDSAALASSLATAQADLDIITGATGVNLLTATQASIDAIKGDTNSAIPTILGTPVGASLSADIAAVQAAADGVQSDLDNATDGLGALKTLIDTVNTDLSNATDGLGAIKTAIDAANTDLANGTDGLGALKALIDTVDTVVDGIQTDLDNGTDGLGAIKAETALILTDTGTTIPALLPAALVGGKMDSNIGAISGSTDAADKLEDSCEVMFKGSCTSNGTTTTIVDTTLGSRNDTWIGRVVVFKTGTLVNEASEITDYDQATNTLTVVTLTGATTSGDTYQII